VTDDRTAALERTVAALQMQIAELQQRLAEPIVVNIDFNDLMRAEHERGRFKVEKTISASKLKEN
jgi:hypothetical protein